MTMESPTTILTHGLTAVLSKHMWAGFSVFCHVMNWWQEGLKEQSRTMLTGEKGLDTIPLPWESLSFCWSNLMRYNPLSFRTVKLQSFYSGSTFSGRSFEYRSRQGNDSYHLSVMFIFAILCHCLWALYQSSLRGGPGLRKQSSELRYIASKKS